MTNEPTPPLFLSRLLLNPRSRQVLSEILQPYEMHRTLMRAFPKATDDTQSRARGEFGVLFRAEVDDRRGDIKVYVQSRIQPDWSFLDDLNDYLRTAADMPRHEFKDVMPSFRKIQNGQLLSFRLRANPTKRVANPEDAMTGKRVLLAQEAEQIAWLTRKGQAVENGVPGGFDLLIKEGKDAAGQACLLPNVRVSTEGKQIGRKIEENGGHQMTHFAVLFEGLMRVTDTSAFLETLVRGIGSGKAFGFGLLSIAPVRT